MKPRAGHFVAPAPCQVWISRCAAAGLALGMPPTPRLPGPCVRGLPPDAVDDPRTTSGAFQAAHSEAIPKCRRARRGRLDAAAKSELISGKSRG